MKTDLQSRFSVLSWKKKILSAQLAQIQTELKQVAWELDEQLRGDNMIDKQCIFFTIIGRISGNHRATQFRDKSGVRRSFRNKDYEATRRLIRLAATQAAKDYVQPVPKTTTRVYLHFCIGTHTLATRKQTGQRYWQGRPYCDADNLKKSILDALQGIFYANDRYAVALPFDQKMNNDNPYITRFDNREGNRRDSTEIKIESTPHEQYDLGKQLEPRQ